MYLGIFGFVLFVCVGVVVVVLINSDDSIIVIILLSKCFVDWFIRFCRNDLMIIIFLVDGKVRFIGVFFCDDVLELWVFVLV